MRRTVLLLAGLLTLGACDDEAADDAGLPSADAGDGTTDAGDSMTDAGDGTSDAGDSMTDAGDGTTDAGPPSGDCALPPPFDEGVAYSTTLHVATDGTAAGPGTAAAPFDTIRGAIDAAGPGTRILVAAGTYAPTRLDGVTGEADAPIAIVADGEVILDGGGSATPLAMSDPRYVVLEGLTLANAGVHGMNIDDGGSYDTPAHHVVLRDITVPGAGSGGNNDCIKLSGLDDFWIEGSALSACDRGEAVDMVGCHRGVIHGNDVREVVGNGIQTKGGSSDVLIHGNRFTDIPGRAVNAGGSTGLEFFRPDDAPHEAANIRVIANLFVDVGAESGAPVAFVGCDGCVVANNTIIRPQTWVARILQETTGARFVPSRDGRFVNNLVVLNTGDLRTFVNVGGGTAPETFVFGHNLWWALDEDASWGGPTYPGGLPAEMDSVIQRDPGLTDLAGGDYRPSPGGPAEAAGEALASGAYPDFDGRCFADPPSLGAYETVAP